MSSNEDDAFPAMDPFTARLVSHPGRDLEEVCTRAGIFFTKGLAKRILAQLIASNPAATKVYHDLFTSEPERHPPVIADSPLVDEQPPALPPKPASPAIRITGAAEPRPSRSHSNPLFPYTPPPPAMDIDHIASRFLEILEPRFNTFNASFLSLSSQLNVTLERTKTSVDETLRSQNLQIDNLTRMVNSLRPNNTVPPHHNTPAVPPKSSIASTISSTFSSISSVLGHVPKTGTSDSNMKSSTRTPNPFDPLAPLAPTTSAFPTYLQNPSPTFPMPYVVPPHVTAPAPAPVANAAAPPVPQPPVTGPNLGRTQQLPKIPTPAVFTGDVNDAEPFLTRMYNFLEPFTGLTTLQWIGTVRGYMQGDKCLRWISEVNERGDGGFAAMSWDDFKAEFLGRFRDPIFRDLARTKLKRFFQGTKTIIEFNSEFKTLCIHAGYNINDAGDGPLLEDYKVLIRREILEAVDLYHRDATTLPLVMAAAKEEDARLRRNAARRPQYNTPMSTSRTPNPPTLTTTINGTRVPPWKSLSPSQQLGVCVLCRADGHRAADCPVPEHIRYQVAQQNTEYREAGQATSTTLTTQSTSTTPPTSSAPATSTSGF